jgi:hypothetical protein
MKFKEMLQTEKQTNIDSERNFALLKIISGTV